MRFDEYQLKAKETAVFPPERGLDYLTLGLCNEAGEVAGKIKKIIRGDYSDLDEKHRNHYVAYELGDVLWYLAMLASEIGYSLEEIAEMNIDKLQKRKLLGMLKGDGDER